MARRAQSHRRRRLRTGEHLTFATGTTVTLLLLAASAAGSTQLQLACDALPGPKLYIEDACYASTNSLDASTGGNWTQLSSMCTHLTGYAGHLAYATSQSLVDAWQTFVGPTDELLYYLGMHRVSAESASAQDGWHFTTSTGGRLHAAPLDATVAGDPPNLLPWLTSSGQPANGQPVEMCANLNNYDGRYPYGVWDNDCGRTDGAGICEYSEVDNMVSNVIYVKDHSLAGKQLKSGAVTSVHRAHHHLLCLLGCTGAQSECRCVTYDSGSALCSHTPFPCSRADIFETDNTGNVAVYKRKHV